MLTGNDIALAQQAAALAIAWWKTQPEEAQQTTFAREQIARLRVLIKKLNEIADIAYPYDSDDVPLDCGDEPIMRLNSRVVNKTRARAKPERVVQ